MLGVRYQTGNGGTADSGGNGDVSQNSILTSEIQDGVGTAGTPADLQPSLFTGNQYAPFNVTGASTYAGGTLIRSAANIINVTASGATVGTLGIVTTSNSSLGSDNVTVEATGNMRLNSAASVKVADGASITHYGDALNNSVLALGHTPGSQPAIGLTSGVASGAGLLGVGSTGALAIDTATFSLALNMAMLGNGSMFLGSFPTGIYTASTLGVGANAPTPGTGTFTPTYRLGTGGGQNSNNTLTISGTSVITGSANLVINEPGARDTSNHILGAPIGEYGGQGTVKFNNAQNFTGTITVNGGFQEALAGTLETVVSSTAGVQPFPTTTPVSLVDGNLQFNTPTGGIGRTDLAIGDLRSARREPR